MCWIVVRFIDWWDWRLARLGIAGDEQALGSIAENLDVSFVPDDADDDWQVFLSGASDRTD